MGNIAIITARGGSKRIPKKNIKPFCGKPIIEYSIETALDSSVFDEVMVSTDDEEIAYISKRAGAKVPFFRSKKNSDDHATTSDVIKEVLNAYAQNEKKFDYGCCIYPTAPFITTEKLKNAMSFIKTQDIDTVIPVVTYSFPPQRAIIIKNGLAKMQFPENQDLRSQDLQPIYHDCGQFYTFNVNSFMRSGNLLGGKMLPMIMNTLEVQDIDNVEDWKIAEIKYKMMKGV